MFTQLEVIDDAILDTILAKVGADKKGSLTLEQFSELVTYLDDIGNSISEEDGFGLEVVGDADDDSKVKALDYYLLSTHN